MRIIGGIAGGRILKAPDTLPVRPTTDRAKESLFNILENRIDLEGLDVLDLFSGTGNIGFEFASRGAASVVCVDQFPGCVKFIRQTSKALNLSAIEVVQADVLKYLKTAAGSFGLIFADPPYGMKELPELPGIILNQQLLNPDGILIVEHATSLKLNHLPGHREDRTYGQSTFSFFSS